MRISFVSNAPWSPTGYGVQAAEVVPHFKKDGHEVAVMANYGLAGMVSGWPTEHGVVPVYPHGLDPYSNDLAPYQAADWTQNNQAGWTVILFDTWVFRGPGWENLNIAAWAPVDHKPVPAAVRAFFDQGKGERLAIAMSRFGEQELLASGLPRDRVLYAPHSVNTSVFKPMKTDLRAEMGIPGDAFVVVINAANKGNTPIRKCWPEMIAAFSQFAKKHDDAYLYVHSELAGIGSGVNMERLFAVYGVPPDRVKVAPQWAYKQGLPQSTVAAVYNIATDNGVLLSTSRGEGFGLSVLEAQACGAKVITTNWTAQTELTGVGWSVEGQLEWDEFQGAFWKVPNVGLIVEALEQAYLERGNEELKKAAVDFASAYATEKVYNEHWKPIIARLEKSLDKQEPNRQARRAAKRGK